MTAKTEPTLPELPYPPHYSAHPLNAWEPLEDLWDESQMRSYAAAAVLLERERLPGRRDDRGDNRGDDSGGGCTLAGPGRGDCERFIGLPGRSIPGRHDGPDDTVDAYGKPNGWCWSCWKSKQIVDLRGMLAAIRSQKETG
jgi:hypothetical protein